MASSTSRSTARQPAPSSHRRIGRSAAAAARAYRTSRDLGKAIAQAVVFDGTFRPRVCIGNPPATPPTGGGSGATTPPSVNGKPCMQNSQCGAGAICASPSAGEPKVCLLI
jgi:hypothetical protein